MRVVARGCQAARGEGLMQAGTRRSSKKRGPNCFPKSDRWENDDSGRESQPPKHNRFSKQNSFRQG